MIGDLSWRNRLQDAQQPESALPPQARSGETLLAGEHSEAQWGISGYADLVREWDEPVQTSQSLELGTLYWRTPLGERSQLQVGKFTLDIDPSYGSHPAGFFQAAANPFDDFLPDVGTPMLALTHWWGEAWSGNLLLQKSPDDDSRRAGAVLTYQTAAWLIHGVVTERSPEGMENAVTLLHPGQGLWSWHGSLAGSGRGEDKLDLLLGTVREDEQDKLVLEYSYNRNRYTYRQLQTESRRLASALLGLGLKPGDRIMGMSLAEGGHLTHGMPLNMSGKWFNVVAYGLDAKEEIDYDKMEALAREHKPRIIIAGASAYALRIDFERFAKIAKEVGAIFWVDMAHYAGLIAAGYYPNPVPHADVVTSTTHKTLRGPRGGIILMKAEHEKALNSAIFPGLQGGPLMHVIAAKAVAFKEAATPEFKHYQEQVLANARVMARVLGEERGLRIISGRTESHVFLVDLRSKNITGKEAEAALGRAHITVNKNSIPNDPQKPFVTSGIRIGSPAMTTRGFTEIEAERIAHLIADVLDNPNDEATAETVRAKVSELCRQFPVYGA